MKHSAISQVKETFENWAMYDAVIQHNYMRHRDLVREIEQIAAACSGSLKIVDLGCGDAWLAAHAFAEAKVESYLGIDLSESAIERARSHLSAWSSRATLRCGNLADAIKSLPDGSANFVLASNSLHHFDMVGKSALMHECFRLLTPGGVFCWVDPVRDACEDRSRYLTRLCDAMQNDWTGLSLDYRRRGTQHVWASDYPETEQWMREQAELAGFQFASRFLNDPLFGAWKFVKP